MLVATFSPIWLWIRQSLDLNISFIRSRNWTCEYTTFITNRRRIHSNHHPVDLINGSRHNSTWRFPLYSSIPTRIRTKKQKRKPTQYLTRFDNLLTSSGQERERDFIDSTTNTICTFHIIQGGSAPLFIAKRPRNLGNPNWICLQFKNKLWIQKKETDPRPDIPVGRPCSTESLIMSVGRPGDRSSYFVYYPMHICAHRSTGRSVRSCFVYTGRPGGRSTLLLVWYKLHLRSRAILAPFDFRSPPCNSSLSLQFSTSVKIFQI